MSTPVCKVWDAEQGKYVGIPAIKGPKGDQGEKGDPGPKGEPGAPGKDGAGMDITGATVGQIAKITAVDASGVPTAWGAVDMPSGGSSDAVLYTAQELTYGQKFQARKNIEAADRVMPTITGGVSLCPANVTDSNTAVHTTTTTAGGDDFTLTLDGGPENALVRVKGIRTPTDTDTNAAATVEYVKNKVSEVSSSGGITVDTAMSDTSTNPVQNKAIKKYIDDHAVSLPLTLTYANGQATGASYSEIRNAIESGRQIKLAVANTIDIIASQAKNKTDRSDLIFIETNVGGGSALITQYWVIAQASGITAYVESWETT